MFLFALKVNNSCDLKFLLDLLVSLIGQNVVMNRGIVRQDNCFKKKTTCRKYDLIKNGTV